MLRRHFSSEFEKRYHYPPAEYQIAPSHERMVFNTSLDMKHRIEAVSWLGELRLREDFLGEDASSSLKRIASDASLERELQQEAVKWLSKRKESIDTWPDETEE